jgi:anti-sigma B factor antagonist
VSVPGVQASRPDGTEVVVLPAEIDVCNAEMVRIALLAVLRRGVRRVIADMSATAFCDCTGVAALLAASNEAERAAAEVCVVASGRQVLRLFDLTGLSGRVTVFPTVAAARGSRDDVPVPDS